MNEQLAETQQAPEPGLVQYTNWIYALHSLSVLIGIVTGASVAGRFVFGLPSIIAVFMNYARRREAHNTYLESHFRWQIRTFWFTLLWLVITAIVAAPLTLVLVGFVVWIIGFVLIGVWVIYRIARGWLAVRDSKAI